MLFLLKDSPQKLKLKNIHDTLIILFYVSPGSPQLKGFTFSIKNTHTKKSAAAVGCLVINITCHYPMLIMSIKSIKNKKN